MFSTFRTTAIGAAVLALAQFASPARAAFTFTMEQVGSGVVVDGSGSINTGGATLTSGSGTPGMVPLLGALNGGGHVGSLVDFSAFTHPPNFTGPSNFGTFVFPGEFSATTASGDFVGIQPGFAIFVPPGYVSGNSLSNTTTFASETFASLGVIPGTYTWSWGTGANADHLTLRIGAVPEPASLVLLAAGLAGLGMVLRTRRA
jgi:hypothetical protein